MNDDDMVAAVRQWVDELLPALRLDAIELDLEAVLGTAGLAARASVRPAAPVTTYLVGYAVGRASAQGAAPADAFAQAVTAVRAVAEQHRSPEESP
jgi:hypothetical protein